MGETDDPISRFTTAAERYVRIVDGAEDAEPSRLLAELGVALAILYGAAVQLPKVDLPDEPEPDEPGLGEAISSALKRAGHALRVPGVGPPSDGLVPGDPSMTTGRFFWALATLRGVVVDSFDWSSLDEDWGMAADTHADVFADEFAEVYQDVRNSLAKIAMGEREGEPVLSHALWEVRFDFWNHWGHHAVSAMRMMHSHLQASGHGPETDPQ